MTDPTCANCTYECDSVNAIGLCQTCENAYDSGDKRGRRTEYARWIQAAERLCKCDVDYFCDFHHLINEAYGK